MPKLEAAGTSTIVKVLLIGDSGTGKTGAIHSLVKAGYFVHVWDFDNKIAGGILPILVKRDCPEKLSNVDYEPLRDKFKSSGLGPIPDGLPTAFTKGLALLDKWTDGTSPKEWGERHVVVIDSLTFMSDAAFNWAKAMNPSVKEPRQWFYTAQQVIEGTIAMMTADSFRTNLVVIAHINWQNRPDGTMKGFPSSVGTALNSTIPAYFENMAQCHIVNGKRLIQTAPTALLDLKNPAAFKMLPSISIETGLADFFSTLKG